jgi:hypothetical protein
MIENFSGIEKCVLLQPSTEYLEEIWRLSEYRVFYDPLWTASLNLKNEKPVWFVLLEKNIKKVISLAVHVNGPIGGRLVFPTSPIFLTTNDNINQRFWKIVKNYISKTMIYSISFLSFDSYPYSVPSFFRNKRATEKEEFIWDISNDAGFHLDKISKNHKRNIKKAENFQFSIQSGSDLAFLDAHIKMLGYSSERRFLKRGAQESYRSQRDRLERFLRSGHGKIWQAIYEGEVVSSVLLLGRGPRRYYQSGGTSGAGMNMGASQWLFWNLASKLREEGVTVINLAGVSKGQEGLRRFKEGFNTLPVSLSNVYFNKLSDNKTGKAIDLLLKVIFKPLNSIIR